jgi:hypothetical protein
MAVTTIQGSAVPFAISTDAGTTYKTVVCNKAWGLTVDTTVNEDESDCGRHVGLGTVKASFSIDGLYNTTPSSTEISGEELLSLATNKTSFLFKTQYPTSGSPGADLYAQGSAYLTNYQITKSTNSLIGFSGTILVDGNLDITV